MSVEERDLSLRLLQVWQCNFGSLCSKLGQVAHFRPNIIIGQEIGGNSTHSFKVPGYHIKTCFQKHHNRQINRLELAE